MCSAEGGGAGGGGDLGGKGSVAVGVGVGVKSVCPPTVLKGLGPVIVAAGGAVVVVDGLDGTTGSGMTESAATRRIVCRPTMRSFDL